LRTYTVRLGDTLGRISRSVYGDVARWTRIAAANALVNPNQLFVGQILRIPPLGAPAPDRVAQRFERVDAKTAEALTGLAPPLRTRADRLLQECRAGGLRLAVTQGLRTWHRQDALFAQGRTAPGEIVTNARGGQSYHNFGLAFDVVVLNDQGRMVWDPAHPGWRMAAETGKQLGLAWGGDWRSFRDLPHFERRGTFGLQRCRQLFTDGGLPAIWNELGS
jgi:LysM repeat protein